ncbi:FtsX-like permease family protein [Roseovarius litorisediminis]|uniref:FtsX-like permease family protein n=1 Tax=Roseovarius litorisediminis TaxID=1312363 RepID=A0A1Y5RAV8_9RHOB|nr:FtsX-like permease family protein [Roseovarius litorisediminis]SLN12794.1 FtsX-like permease family protein [Roseovarius litorisediminis]
MRALDKKLLRDFRRLWAQALAIALVLACGVAILLTTYGMYGALEDTRTAYYERNRFADVFGDANRVPRGVLQDITAIDGVRTAEARVVKHVILDVPGRIETVTGRILSLPENGVAQLNLPLMRQGRLPDPTRADEVVVNAPFAKANNLQPGDQFFANLNGQKRELTLTGTALSPEFIYTIGPGALLPDNKTFGILWMPERAVSAAFDMEGAFNNVTLKLDPSAIEAEVIDRLDDLLDPYGGLGAYGRDIQVSNSFIDAEIAEQRNGSMILPPIFYGISAFLVSMVIGRIIALERSEIGLLKAVGYSDVEICIHYLMLACLIAVLGTLLGWGVGTWLSRAVARIYARFFDFPYLVYRVSYDAYAISGILAVLSAALGAAKSALSAARIAPAVAMAPPAPPRFKRTLLDRVMTVLRLSQPVMMILRSIVRWPVRSALTTLGLSLAAAVLVASSFFSDALDVLMQTTFDQANRQDATLMFSPDVRETALTAVANLPGVLKAEGQQFHAAVLRHGHLEKDTPIEARRPGTDLSRIVNGRGRIVDAPADGILLSERLATHLEVQPGDVIQIELKGGRNETHDVIVSGIVTQYFGLGAYMDLESLNRLLRQAPQITTANLLVDTNQLPDLHRVLKDTPELSGLVMLNEMRRSFQDTIRQNITIMTSIYVVIAVLITFGVAYNGARIQLSERARELASLRILGFTRAEVSFILMGETMLLAVLAQPLGWLLGAGIASALSKGSTSDLYAIPLVLEPSGFARASLIVLGAALLSSLIVRRRLDRLDLIQVMKTRE